MKTWALLITLSFLGHVRSQGTYFCHIRPGTNVNQNQALKFLESYNTAAETQHGLFFQKGWDLQTNNTNFNYEELVKQSSILAQFYKEMRAQALQFNASAMFEDVKRQLGKITRKGASAEPSVARAEELASAEAQMKSIYEAAKVCLTPNNCLDMEPGISSLLATSRDYETLKSLWVGWRNETGRKMKDLYTKFVRLSNEAVPYSVSNSVQDNQPIIILRYRDTGDVWRSVYESDTFVDDVQDLWNQVRPLYEQLHAYVRRRLTQVYGKSRFPASGHIPAHILGNMWAQTWDNLAELVKPFPKKTSMDVTPEMVKQNYTVDKIFRTAEDFFVSLGFERMVPSFWNLSMLEEPTDERSVMCLPTAADFANKRDFRILMCTNVNQKDLISAHEQMSYIVYFMEYKNQPFVYRDEANPGFFDAVANVMIMSVQTPEHMKRLGLIKEVPTDNEIDINFLMNMALEKVTFLPYGYLLDQWRWSVFRGQTTPATYSKDFWNLTCHLQGISPPVARSEDDFDPGADYNVPAAVPYIRQFVSFILQFQFHQAACQAAGHVGPLHKCDIYNNKEAGRKLRNMQKLGSSKPWPEAMKQLTAQTKMSAEPLLEYFKPLYDFLRRENGKDYGWQPNCPVPS